MGDDDAPRCYTENVAGKLGTLQGELHWHYFDLCHFHQIMYGELERRSDLVGAENEKFKKHFKSLTEDLDDDDNEALMVYQSRFNTAVIDRDIEIGRAKRFADEYSVIGLWAMAERYLSRVFASVVAEQTGVDRSTVQTPYRWNDFVAGFDNLGIDLTALDGFGDADECRVLNNTIKHAEIVDNRLGQYACFTGHVNEELSKIEFEMQRYASGVYSFCGSLIAAGNKLLDATFPY